MGPDKMPVLDADPYAVDILRDPYSFHEALREAGPFVELSAYGIYATGRYETVTNVLSDHGRFTTTAGVGLTDIRKPGSWRDPNPTSEVDPPDHTTMRSAMTKILSPIVIRSLREAFEKEAKNVAERVLDTGEFDAVADVAQPFVIKVVMESVGIDVQPEEYGNVVAISEMNFNQMGPQNALYEKSMARVGPILDWYKSRFQRENLIPGGIGEKIYLAADAGELKQQNAALHVRTFMRAGTDTTIAALGHTLHALARDPAAWEAVRTDIRKIRAAFDEAIRFQSPAQIMYRTTRAGTVVDGVRLEADRKVACFLGAANRDPRKWGEADIYDATRNTAGVHLGFGAGIHVCLGQMIARLEAECMLGALASRIKALEPNGEPTIRPINTLRTLENLPLRAVAA